MSSPGAGGKAGRRAGDEPEGEGTGAAGEKRKSIDEAIDAVEGAGRSAKERERGEGNPAKKSKKRKKGSKKGKGDKHGKSSNDRKSSGGESGGGGSESTTGTEEAAVGGGLGLGLVAYSSGDEDDEQ